MRKLSWNSLRERKLRKQTCLPRSVCHRRKVWVVQGQVGLHLSSSMSQLPLDSLDNNVCVSLFPKTSLNATKTFKQQQGNVLNAEKVKKAKTILFQKIDTLLMSWRWLDLRRKLGHMSMKFTHYCTLYNMYQLT